MDLEKIDNFDRKILQVLQDEGDIGPQEMSSRVHLSASQCSRRLQRLRTAGFIARTVVALDPKKLNLNVCAYIFIRLKTHAADAEARFNAKVSGFQEVVSCEYLTGETDVIMKVLTKDLETYSDFISGKLAQCEEIYTLRSSIILKGIKNVTSMPLGYC